MIAFSTTNTSPLTTTPKEASSSRTLLRVVSSKKWDDMMNRLRVFYDSHGHTFVSLENTDDVDLYRWTQQIRRNYRHQVLKNRKILNRIPRCSSSTADASPAADSLSSEEEEEELQDLPNISLVRSKRRPHLSPFKLAQLESVHFLWDVQEFQWHKRYQQLVEFHQKYGHCRVPNNSLEFPQLGFWVRNQRREFKKLQQQLKEEEEEEDQVTPASSTSSSSSSTLTSERLRLLQELGFEWYKSHQETWEMRYQQLLEFKERHGHVNVPEDYAENWQLGQWCMNQRVAYKKRMSSNPQQQQQTTSDDDNNNNDDNTDLPSMSLSTASLSSCSAMTPERMERLEKIGFQWQLRMNQWEYMKERLVDFYRQHGHLNIPDTHDKTKEDGNISNPHEYAILKAWLIRQRYYYKRRYKDGLSSPMTLERVQALERAIPNFSWQVRGNAGPSLGDWAKLFDAMRAKGLKPGMRPKKHWFEGTNPFADVNNVKHTWTEQDLLALWNQDDDDYDDDE